MKRVLPWLALVVFALAGCATKQSPTTPEATPTPTPAATPVQPAKPKLPLMTRTLATMFGWTSKILPKKKAEPPKAQPAQQIGTVRLVNKEEGFVLIDLMVTPGEAAGGTLVSIKDGRQTSVLKISGFHNPPFLIADIFSGDPAKDDKVYKP